MTTDAHVVVSEAVSSHRRTASWAAVLCLASIVAGLGLRLLYLAEPWRIDMSERHIFLSDEGVVGLMARHILEGARPVFFYGQHYMGALEAYLAALVFRLADASMTTLRAVPTLFAVAWIPLTYALGRRLYGPRAAWLAAALVAVPSQFVFVWGMKARGGFAEHVAFSLALLYLVILLMERVTMLRLVCLGLLTGLALWMNQLMLAYVPVFAYALYTWVCLRRSDILVLLLCSAIGMAPLLYGNVIEPLGTARVLARKIKLTLQQREVAHESDAMDAEAPKHIVVPLLQVLGQERGAAWNEARWTLPGLCLALWLVFGALAASVAMRRWRQREPRVYRLQLLLLAMALLSIVAGLGGFTGEQVGRYQLLLFPVLALLTAGWAARYLPRLAVGVTALLVLGQTISLAAPVSTEGRTSAQMVLAALRAHGLHYGYSAGSMYDLVFQAAERRIIVPLDRSRYISYETLRAAHGPVFYLYRDDQTTKPHHRALLDYLASNRVRYQQFEVGEYHVLYGFEPPDSLLPPAISAIRARARPGA